MPKIAVVTDSNSGITQSQAERLRICVLPMPFMMDGESFFEDINLSQETFYRKLSEGADISTSQPAIGEVIDTWDRLLKNHDAVVHIPMSSGLSASCVTAVTMAREYGDAVQVVDNHRISVTQRQSVLDAIMLAEAGLDARQIKERLEAYRHESSIYIMLDTLHYLKKGGRVTPAGAAIGTLLNIKPVLQLQGDKLDAYAKVRGMKQARAVLLDAMRNDFRTRFADCCDPDRMWLQIAYSHDREAAQSFLAEAQAAFPGFAFHIDALSLSVACHIGPNALAIACSKRIII